MVSKFQKNRFSLHGDNLPALNIARKVTTTMTPRIENTLINITGSGKICSQVICFVQDLNNGPSRRPFYGRSTKIIITEAKKEVNGVVAVGMYSFHGKYMVIFLQLSVCCLFQLFLDNYYQVRINT